MSTDVSKVYLFLAQNGGISAADKNGDGTVIKSEFRSFMEDNFEWDGETTDEGKNDLINTFWKTIDTQTSGKISGTKYKNKNALSSSEVDAMEVKIQAYQTLDTFASSLTMPTVVSDTASWKKSVTEGLSAKVEEYLKTNTSVDGLEEYLTEISPAIEKKATADYCANEYLASSDVSSLLDGLDYAYGSDNSLQSMVNNYIANIPEDATDDDIKSTIENMIQAYLATAGLTGDNAFDLSEYGYSANETSALNDLQKAVLKKELETNLESIKNEADYEANSSLYDTAVTEYITSVLNETKNGELETAKGYGVEQFKSSKTGTALAKTIEVKNLFSSDELKSALTTAIGESFAERVGNIMTGEISSYDTLMNDVLEKAKAGDFDVNGTLDIQKAIDYIVKQMKANLADYYPNGLSDMSLDELSTTYDALVASAKENNDASKIKEAAISYCKALAAKSTKFAEIVKNVFGGSYATEINKMLSGDIETKIAELKEQAAELGDANELKLNESSWGTMTRGGSNGEIVVTSGETQSFYVTPTFTDKDGTSVTVTSDRITYKSSNENLAAVDDSGKVTIKGTTPGTYSVTISILVDGVSVEQKTIVVKVKANSEIDFAKAGYTLEDNGEKELFSKSLSGKKSQFQQDLPNNLATDTSTLKSWIEGLYSAIVSSNQPLDSVALETAKDQMIELYTLAMKTIYSETATEGRRKRGSGSMSSFDYNGTTYQAARQQDDDGKEFGQSAKSQKAENNQLGICLNVRTDRQTYTLTINTQCMMDMFQKLYKAALGE